MGSKKIKMGVTIEEAIKKNPFNPNKGNKSVYCRYLRYNVEGWYLLGSKEVLRRWREEVEDGNDD